MATQRFPKRFASLTKSRKYRDRARQAKESKRLQLETLEDRRLMALIPPVILPNSDALLNDGAVLTVAPKDVNFEFNDLLDPLTISNGIRLIRSGKDGVFDPPGTPGSNDQVIVPGFIGLNDDARQVVMRFSSPLPDDVYRIEIIGSGAAPLRDASGVAFNGGVDYSIDFRLDLGAQIIAVVPQPVRRNASGQLEMMMPDPADPSNSVTSRNKIVVYFNDDDLVDGPSGAENPEFYKLFATFNSLDPADDVPFMPTNVNYDPVTDTAVLTFDNFADQRPFEQFVPSDGSRDTAKSFRLRVGTTESRRLSTTAASISDPGSSFTAAIDIGTILTSGTPLADAQGASAQYSQAISAQSLVLPWPGDGTEPGHRDIPAENHLGGFPDTSPTGSTATIFYNFQPIIGSIPDGIGGSQPAFNLITAEQKQRAREIFDLYSRFAGVQFVESISSGLTVATGDMRALDPLIPTGPGGVIGLAGGGLAIMDNAEDWNDQYGAGSLQPGQFSWFETAMHEIGHLLGLGHSYDLPPNTIQGDDGSLRFLASPTPSPVAEPVYPGDHDIVHMRNLYRPDNKDIDMYRFALNGSGVFTAETFSERLPNSSNLDTHITVWRENTNGSRELIARNDDYFSKDSFLELNLGPGVYYVGVSASGNHYYDPTVDDSGIGGLTQGNYEVKFDFRKNASTSLVDAVTPANPAPAPEVPDTLNVAFDGDADGNPGGTYNFWFRSAAPLTTSAPGATARTIFVDRTAVNPPVGTAGSLATPFNEIDLALAAAQPYDIVRIVGNGGADGNLDTLHDNVAYQVGFSNGGGVLRDGQSLNVPKDVTVMVEAGTIFHMFRSYVSVGSTAPSIAADRSGGALQVLGTPPVVGGVSHAGNRVYFTTNNEGPGGIGRDDNTSIAPPAAGDWGGLAFTTELDRADGRFVHEEVGVFLNYVNHADIRFGGGQVNVDSSFQVVTPISMTDARPTITQNLITRSADAAMSANSDSFEETNFQAPRYWPAFSTSTSYTLDYNRVGPEIRNNILVDANLPNVAVNGNVTVSPSSTPRTSAAISHTVPVGSDRLLVVSVMTDGDTDVTSITYGGLQLTQALEQDSGATGQSVEIWYLKAPAVGTANVVVNFAGSTDPSAITATNFTGVDQNRPIGGTVVASATTGTAISANLTTSAANSVLLGVVSAQGGPAAPFTPGAGVVERWDVATGADPAADIGGWGGTLAVPSAGTATFAATSTTDGPWDLAVVEIRKVTPVGNSTNALFIRTTTPAGDVLEELTVAARFDDTDIVHVIQENLSIRGTPSGAILEQNAPPVSLVVSTSQKVTPGSGPGFAIGTNLEYKVVYVDLLGNEGLASATINVTVTDPDLLDPTDTSAHVRLENLNIPTGDFVGRRLYRRINGSGAFTLVDLLPAQLTTFVDRNLPRSGQLQNLRVNSTPSTIQRARLDGSLVIDPSLVVKSDGARIDVGIGANFLAEGVDGLPIIFTSLYDDRYGAGGSFDTPQDNSDNQPKTAAPGDWGGIFIGPNSKASIDYAVVAFAGGLNRIEGTFAGFNAIEIHEADARVAHVEFESNANGSGGQAPANRFGRGANAPGVIFVRGAQPVILENIVHDNEAAFININVNALNSDKVVDAGRQVGSHFNAANQLIGRMPGRIDNNGPLVRNNRMVDNANNGMIVRGGTLTTEVVMDDTDIVHVVFDAINVPDFHTFGGIRLESSPIESLVVKFLGLTAGITATGRPLEIDDRIGGILHILGQPGFPVVLTSFTDDSAGAGFTPDGFPQTDTNGDGGSTTGGGGGGGGSLPPPPPATGELQVTPNNNAAQLVNAMLLIPAPTGVTITNSTYVGAATAAGTYINGDEVPLEIYPTGIILTSGDAVIPSSNTNTSFTGSNGLGGDADLTALIGGTATRDATILTLTIDVAPGSGIRSGSFDFQFGSEEFDEFVGSPFNDVIGAFINGGAATNVMRDSQGNLVSINSGFFDINNLTDTFDIEYDGMTSGLTARFPLQIGTNVLKIAIADAVDTSLDSGALLTNLQFSSADVGTGGVGAVPVAGEWQGITIDQYAHDRNVETILELESPTSDGTSNAIPTRAQPLGNLGPQEKSGDESLRLGFTVHGVIGQPSDVDVYSFIGRAGTEIWIDIDRTWHSLNSVVELIDNLGNVLARSQDSPLENLGDGTATNIGRDMQKVVPFEGVDQYTTNTRDPGMRLVLPGPSNSLNTYHVRIRSNAGAQVSTSVPGSSSNSTIVTGGTSPVTTVTEGGAAANEIQQIPALGAVGTFTLTFNGQTTLLLPATASATDIQNALVALNNLAPGDVTVTRNANGTTDVAFQGAFANQNLAPMILGRNEVQSVAITNSAGQPGNFTLTFGAETTTPILNSASAADVQAALEALNAFAPGDIVVTKSETTAGVINLTFEFRGPSFANLDILTSITASRNNNEFERITLLGTPSDGTFTLTFQGQTTLPIAFNATASDVHAALAALPAIGGAANIAVTGADGGPWDVEFRTIFASAPVLLTVNTEALVAGLTQGAYQAQIRLREVDEFGGSTVRFANIKYAQNGIRVLGQPTHSPLAGEHTEIDNAANGAQTGAQNLGNLLRSDRGVMSVAGEIGGIGDIDWYEMQVQYGATQGIPGVSTSEDWWSTIFDLDYADGFARPNTVINIYDAAGNLVLSSRDSNIADDRPNPLNGSDVSDLSRGSSGAADPFIGPVELVQGTYYVAVSTDNRMPQLFDQFTQANATSPLIRLEPINSVQRIVEDRRGGPSTTTGSDPIVPNFINQGSFMPWRLHDVTMFVTRDTTFPPGFPGNQTQVLTVDPFTGYVETTVGTFGQEVSDIAMHPNGTLYSYSIRRDPEGGAGAEYRDAQAGNYYIIDTGTGQITFVGDDGIQTYEQDPANVNPAPVIANVIPGPTRVGEGVHFRAMEIANIPGNALNGNIAGLAIGGRDELALNGSDEPNILYIFDPNTGVVNSLGPDRQINPGVLPNGKLNAGTQKVERRVLDTLVDSNPVGNADVLLVARATLIDPVSGATTFNIMDTGYPAAPPARPNEIPVGAITPTTFSMAYGPGPSTTFEFDAGPEALFNINPNNVLNTIRDGQGFRINGGTLVEFDTGHVIQVNSGATAGNFADGTTFTLESPDPNGGAPVPTIFEFDNDGSVTGGNFQIPTNGRNTPDLMSVAIMAAINNAGITTDASRLITTQRITLANDMANFPGVNPLHDTSVTDISTLGMVIAAGTAPGVGATSVQVRIEETSIQSELISAFALANDTVNNPTSVNRPLNTEVGVSDPVFTPGGDGRVTIGFHGNRLNLSGATTITNGGGAANLSTGVFRTVGSQGDITLAVPNRVAVPFLAQDDEAAIAGRMVAAINDEFNPVSPAFVQGLNVVAPNSRITSADPPLTAAAQAPGGTITGMTAVQDFDADGNVISTDIFVVTDTGGLFRLQSAFSRNATLDYINSAVDLVGINFSGLETGPANVEGNRYRELMFGVTEDGVIHAFDMQGNLQQIFTSVIDPSTGQVDAQSSIQLQSAAGVPLNGVHGIRFSTLDRNLWGGGGERVDGDPGHGVHPVVDDSRDRTEGDGTLRFGGYNQPGGAHGTIESEVFSLNGYSPADQPTLYYSYFLDTENVRHGPGAGNGIMRDALRVFIAGDDGVWHMLTTNDSFRGPGSTDDDFDYAPSRVQETWDDTGTWRQVRVTLADFAGQDNLRIRFDYSTAGEMDLGGITVGDELRAVDGFWLRDAQSFLLDFPTQVSTTFNESASNNTLATAEVQSLATTGAFHLPGTISTGLDVDMYRFDLVAGQRVSAEILAERIGSGVDPILRVFNAAGVELAVNDDFIGLDSFVNFLAPATGTYYVGVSSFANFSYNPNVAGTGTPGGSTGPYQIRVSLADRSFEFDMGYTLVAPDGANIPNNAQFNIDGQDFQFVQGGGTIPGVVVINYQPSQTAETIAAAMQAAIVGSGVSPVQRVSVEGNNAGYRLNLRGGGPGGVIGATLVTADPTLPANFVEGEPDVLDRYLVASGFVAVPVHSGMSRDEVREAIALEMADQYAQGVRAQIKTHNEMIRLIGYRWNSQDAGPFADGLNQRLVGVSLQLEGDVFGAFNSNLRGQNNTDEGVYIDDIIIGFAERGEMVSGPGRDNTTFVNNPNGQANNITEGLYQLEIRRAPEAGEPTGSDTLPRLALLPAIDTNDRLTEGRTLIVPPGYEFFDGQTFTLTDGLNQVTFEFNDLSIPGSGVAPGRVRIDYLVTDPDNVMAQRIRTAINSAPVQATLKVAAQLSDSTLGTASTTNQINLIGTIGIVTTGGLAFPIYTEQYGDSNHFRDQGQIILYGNEISNAAQWGILVDNGARSAADGDTPHQGPVRNLREENSQRLVPGVVVTNNTIYRNGTGGILFSGDAGPDNDAVVPFGRIVNNTLYGNGGTLTGGSQTDVGIRVNQAAGPTLLNNIVANFNLGIDVADAASRTQTVVGGTLYQGNDTNSNVALGGPGDFPILLADNEPLFVNAAAGNFYLAPQSRAIDSSVDSLLDRPGLLTVKTPMGIANSPIISPDRDGAGQLRVDDPSVATPNGFGLNPFKDRGAIDRVDFNGPNSILVNPQDNDSLGVDLEPAATVVVLKSQILRDFTIRLIDRFDPEGPAEGSDIDDLSVDTSQVVIEEFSAAGTRILVVGVDYTFSYDTTNNLIRLTPLGGLWSLVRTYRITLNNSPLSGISDRAGNILAPNQPDGTHSYTIFLGSAVDFGDAPDSYGTLQANNGASHQILTGIHLGAINNADTDGQPSPTADLDTSDDGVTFGNLQPGGAADSSSVTVISAAVGKLDAWFDLDQSGTFEASEHVLQAVDLVVGSQLINFAMPTGVLGNTYARFRMSTAGIGSPTGLAEDGEVEDYLVTMTGPEFQNPTWNLDVDNDGFVAPIDALLIITYLFSWTPLVQANGFANIPLPPREPEFSVPVPVLDASGGGLPGDGRYLDVDGDGFLSPSDAVFVINYLNLPPAPAPFVGGEGEGEGEAPATLFAGSSSGAAGAGFSNTGSSNAGNRSALDSAALLVAPDIVIEVQESGAANASRSLEAALQATSDGTLDLTSLASLAPLAGDEFGLSLRLSDRLDEELPIGPLDESAWDDLLGDLALDAARTKRDPQQAR